VLTGEAALLGSGRTGVMLQSTMIYGRRVRTTCSAWPRCCGGCRRCRCRAAADFLVQPIHQDDVTRCLRAALAHRWAGPNALVIAGPHPVRYADFVRAVAAAAGLRKPFILPFPSGPLILAARLTKHVSALPTIQPEESAVWSEDKAFDIAPMRDLLAVEPVPLVEGLALTFAPPHE